jgi:S-adenosylmethionine:tRNA ribosyltransferase-isomerase
VGTTAARVLETITDNNKRIGPGEGYTDLYIFPGYSFKSMDALITNFHLPMSSLLLLISAFAGKDFIMNAYRIAVEEKYRFFSYGDAMLIL